MPASSNCTRIKTFRSIMNIQLRKLGLITILRFRERFKYVHVIESQNSCLQSFRQDKFINNRHRCFYPIVGLLAVFMSVVGLREAFSCPHNYI